MSYLKSPHTRVIYYTLANVEYDTYLSFCNIIRVLVTF